MPPAAGSSQLPLSAFFPSSTSKRSPRTSIPGKAVVPKRKESPVSTLPTEPPRKKRKQKENLTPTNSIVIDDAEEAERTKHLLAVSLPLDNLVGGDADHGPAKPEENEEGRDVNEVEQIIHLGSPTRASANYAHSLDTPPLTPRHADRSALHGAASLPSPPPSASSNRRVGMTRTGEDETRNPVGSKLVPLDSDSSNPEPPHGLGSSLVPPKGDGTVPSSSGGSVPPGPHKEALTPRRSQKAMPPPPVPLKAFFPSSDMPFIYRRNVRSPSRESDKWVPSSQSQEISIPRPEFPAAHSSYERAPRLGGTSQFVPSSQDSEKELPLRIRQLEDPPLPSENITLGVGHIDGTLHSNEVDEEVLSSPEVIESSQSQVETEIDAVWADALRIGRLRWSNRGVTAPHTATSTPSERSEPDSGSERGRPPESQDYFASQESGYSQMTSSTFSGRRSSPLLLPSKLLGPGTSDPFSQDSAPYGSLPVEVHDFLEGFEGRDDDGNELPVDEHNGGGRPLQTATDTSAAAIHEDLMSDDDHSSDILPLGSMTVVEEFLNMFSQNTESSHSQDPEE